jgi:CRISPR-associated protein Csm4
MLSAAILSAWKMLDSNLAELYFQEPPFLLSSCFPFFEHQTPEHHNSPDCHYFLPRPVMDKAVKLKPQYLEFNKKIKKIEWLKLSIWEKVVKGDWNWNHDFCEKDKEYTIIENNLLLPKINNFPEHFKLFYNEENARVAINRLTGQVADGQLFDFARVHYREQETEKQKIKTGLYFLANIDAKQQKIFEAALCLLGDTGIGADRSSGHGLFNWDKELLEIQEPEHIAMSLSLVSPNKEHDMQGDWLEGSAYDLAKRGGWIAGTSYRKKTIRMFTEGSSFQKQLKGDVKDVTPDIEKDVDIEKILNYRIYRDGRGFFVGGEKHG